MNKKTLSGLIYKDYCMSKKELFTNLLGVFALILIMGLLMLSNKIGNMKIIFESLDEDGQREVLKYSAIIAKKYPVIMFQTLGFIGAQTLVKDFAVKWEKFRISSPVTPNRYALGKNMYFLLLEIAGTVLGAIYTTVFSLIVNGKIISEDYLFILLIACIETTLLFFIMNLTILLKSFDMAMVVIVVIASIVFFISAVLTDGSTEGILTFANYLKHHVIILPVYYILIHLFSLFLSVNLYRRRMK